MQPGTQLGVYEVLSVIGKGGMGEVWRARDQKLGRDVALKTLPEGVAEDARGMERFEREARLLASLNHPNIASIYGLEESEGTRFLVLELVEGETLEERLRRGPIGVEEAIGLALQLVSALESAHQRDVIHRDLKPSNIKITPEGKVKVLDFGLAKALAGEAPEGPQDLATVSILATQRGLILGTPGYMSPEQARGEATDRRTDIWAFGCVLFEMLTGRQSFGGGTMTDALASVIARDPEWSLLPANLHPRLRHLLGRCLEKDVRKRYHDISEARIELEAVLADPAGVYAPATGGAAGGQWLPWALFAAASMAFLALLFFRSDAPPQADRPVSRFVASAYPSPPVDVLNANHPMLAMSPDGTQIAYPVVTEGDVLSIYVRGMNRLEGVRLRPQGRMHEPFYSPGGDSIGYVDSDEGALERVTVAGTERPETIHAYDVGIPRGASWGEDGYIVFALVGDGRGLLRVPEVGGAVEELTTVEGPQEEHSYPEVLPGARGVLFTSETPEEGAQINVLDLGPSGEARRLGLAGSQARYMDPGVLVYNDRGVLRAVGFDPDSFEVLGSPVIVLEEVESYPGSLGAQFTVSRSGSLAYINRTTIEDTGTRTLAMVTPAGETQNLANVRPGAYQHPRVSPDESEIAVQTSGAGGRGGIVWIYSRDRSALRQLTQEGSNVRPIWHPDGERVAFASNRDGTWGIYLQAADGSDVAVRLTAAGEGRQHYPDSFSPDGRHLTYTDINPNFTLDQSIWIEDLETNAPAEELIGGTSGGLEFSEDGNWIAYRGNQQIYVEPFPRTGVIHQVTQDGGSFPVWSPNGTQLLYRRTVQAGGSPTSPLVIVDVTTGPQFTFGNEQVPAINGFFTFFGYRDYDFIDNGQRLVMVFPADLDVASGQRLAPRVNVVRNWVEEIRTRLVLP